MPTPPVIIPNPTESRRTFEVVSETPPSGACLLRVDRPHGLGPMHYPDFTGLPVRRGDIVEVSVRIVSRLETVRVAVGAKIPDEVTNEPEDTPDAIVIDRVRKLVGSFDRRCSPGCPGWLVSDHRTVGAQVQRFATQIQRCDVCASLNDAHLLLTDEMVALLPEARSELECTLHHHDG